MASRTAAPDAGRFLARRNLGIRTAFPGGRRRELHGPAPGTKSKPRLSPLGLDDPLSMDEKMANTSDVKLDDASVLTSKSWLIYLIVALVAGAIYLGCSVSPPSLMDDVDGAVAQIARNMVTSGDWATPRADGIAFLEKPAMFYWPIAVSFKIFGIHDWAARIPFALSAIGLACLTCAFGIWAFGRRAGLCAGLCMATCVGLFLFTRIVIPDVTLTLTIALAMWAFLRALDEEEPPAVLGLRARRQPGSWRSAEEFDWRCFPSCNPVAISFPDQAVVCRTNVEAAASYERFFHCGFSCGAVAHSGDAP